MDAARRRLATRQRRSVRDPLFGGHRVRRMGRGTCPDPEASAIRWLRREKGSAASARWPWKTRGAAGDHGWARPHRRVRGHGRAVSTRAIVRTIGHISWMTSSCS